MTSYLSQFGSRGMQGSGYGNASQNPTTNLELLDPFERIRAGMQGPSLGDRQEYARSQGYTQYDPNRGFGRPSGRGYSYWKSPNSFTPPQFGERELMMGSLMDALESDMKKQQDAADENYGRVNDRIGLMENWLENLRPDMMAQAAGSASSLEGYAGQLDTEGNRLMDDAFATGQRAQESADKASQMTLDKVAELDKAFAGSNEDFQNELRQRVGAADEQALQAADLGEQAADQYEQAISQFQDMSAQDASAMAAGIARSAKSQLDQIRGGIGPDGRMLSAPEIADATFQIKRQSQEQIQQAATAFNSRYQETLMGFQTQMAQITQSAAALRGAVGQQMTAGTNQLLQGQELDMAANQARSQLAQMGYDAAALPAQVALQVGSMISERAGIVQNARQLSSSLRQMSAQITNNALFQAAQLELEGHASIASLIRSNPKSVVSEFQSLLGLFSVDNALFGSTPAGVGGGGGSGGAMTSDGFKTVEEQMAGNKPQQPQQQQQQPQRQPQWAPPPRPVSPNFVGPVQPPAGQQPVSPNFVGPVQF